MVGKQGLEAKLRQCIKLCCKTVSEDSVDMESITRASEFMALLSLFYSTQLLFIKHFQNH